MLLVIIIVFVIGCIVIGTEDASCRENAKKRLESLKNDEFEEALCTQICDPSCREQILKIIQSDLEYIYEKHWQEVFAGRWSSPKRYTKYWDKRENIILVLLMSKSGYLPNTLSNPFILANCQSANIYESLKILRCIEKNITTKKNWTDAKLMQVPKNNYVIKGRKTVAVPSDSPAMSNVRWNFDLVNYTRIVSIWDETLEEKCKDIANGSRAEKKVNPYEGKLLI